MSEDCVGEPPGELIIKAMAGAFLSENNLLINLSKEARERPDRIKPACPITPVSLNVGIFTDFEKKFLNIVFLIKS